MYFQQKNLVVRLRIIIINIVTQHFCCPDTKMCGIVTIHTIADSNYSIKAVIYNRLV